MANRRASTRSTPLPPTSQPVSPVSTASCSPAEADLAPHRYSAADTDASVYGVDDLRDAFDLELARTALDLGLPLPVICRGLQVVNVTLGGYLEQDMGGRDHEHRHLVHPVEIERRTLLEQATGAQKVESSCCHHQRVSTLAAGLAVTARAVDGTVEGLELTVTRGWFTAVQWHPEDTAPDDPAQQGIFDALARAARDRR